MSLWTIAWAYLWNRKFTTGLTILSVALSVGLISAVLTLRDETRQRFEEEQQAYDVVVGPSGSPLQLVLNSVYFLDQAIGALPYSKFERIKNYGDPVVNAYPIGLGDIYRTFRIVGTSRELFDYPWENAATGVKRYPFQLREGRYFEKSMEAVVGYRAAMGTGLKLGDTFEGRHGSMQMTPGMDEYDHGDTPYTVVGILKPSGTSNDRAIFVDLQSVWDTHAHKDDDGEEHKDEGLTISAILVDIYSPAEAFSWQAEISKELGVTATRPVQEILNLYRDVLEPAVMVLKGIGYIVVVISAISILIGLYLSIIQRRRDLAIMRALGASAVEIFGAVIIEAFLVTLMGIAAGWVLGKGAAMGLGMYTSAAYGFAITGLGTGLEELQFFAIVGFVGLLAGILPAWQAYQTDVARDLAAN